MQSLHCGASEKKIVLALLVSWSGEGRPWTDTESEIICLILLYYNLFNYGGWISMYIRYTNNDFPGNSLLYPELVDF